MNALETYLRRATRGVWGSKRTELIAELRGSIEARIWMLECQGYASERALEAALTELGEPRAIAAGLIGVHTMPRIFRTTLALSLFAALSVTLINSSRAQIEVAVLGTQISIAPTGVITGPPERTARYLLSFGSIKRNLEAARINVSSIQSKPLKEIDRVPLVPTLSFSFPGGAKQITLQANPLVWKHADGNLVWGSAVQPPADLAESDVYVEFRDFINQLKQQSDLPVELLGWRDLRVKVGSTVLQIGSERLVASPWGIYFSTAGLAVVKSFPQIKSFFYTPMLNTFGVKTNTVKGTVYAVMTTTSKDTELFLDAARVADDGVLYFDAPHKVLEFIRTPLELVRDRANINKRGYGSSSRPAKALLIRITPDLKTSFVLPARVRSGALY